MSGEYTGGYPATIKAKTCKAPTTSRQPVAPSERLFANGFSGLSRNKLSNRIREARHASAKRFGVPEKGYWLSDVLSSSIDEIGCKPSPWRLQPIPLSRSLLQKSAENREGRRYPEAPPGSRCPRGLMYHSRNARHRPSPSNWTRKMLSYSRASWALDASLK